MVKLTSNYLFRKLSKRSYRYPRMKDETDLDYLNRITHLYLQSQFIDKIGPIPQSQSVTVVYLQNNLLQSIHNLDSFPRLTHLYLQHNYISKMENLSSLTCLRKLYLGWNEISVVEGLEGLKNLTELHLENQRLPQGETLYFDPRIVCHLGRCLKVLNISNNNVTSILPLEGLASLTRLIVDGNRIESVEDVAETLYQLPNLEELSSLGNPVASDRKYLDAVVVASASLKILDGKPIDEGTRVFITKMTRNRESRKNLMEFSTKVFDSEESFPDSQGDANQRGKIDASRIGSKLFPVLKRFQGEKRMAAKSNGFPPVFRDSLKITRLSDSSDFSL